MQQPLQLAGLEFLNSPFLGAGAEHSTVPHGAKELLRGALRGNWLSHLGTLLWDTHQQSQSISSAAAFWLPRSVLDVISAVWPWLICSCPSSLGSAFPKLKQTGAVFPLPPMKGWQHGAQTAATGCDVPSLTLSGGSDPVTPSQRSSVLSVLSLRSQGFLLTLHPPVS